MTQLGWLGSGSNQTSCVQCAQHRNKHNCGLSFHVLDIPVGPENCNDLNNLKIILSSRGASRDPGRATHKAYGMYLCHPNYMQGG